MLAHVTVIPLTKVSDAKTNVSIYFHFQRVVSLESLFVQFIRVDIMVFYRTIMPIGISVIFHCAPYGYPFTIDTIGRYLTATNSC